MGKATLRIRIAIIPGPKECSSSPYMFGNQERNPSNGHFLQHHPPRLSFARHDKTRGIFKEWSEFVRLLEAVMEDTRVDHALFPQITSSDAMEFPFWKLVGELCKCRPQFLDAFEFEISSDVE